MMSKIRLIMLLAISLFLVSCQQMEREPYQSFFAEQRAKEPDSYQTAGKAIEIWTPEDVVTATIEQFKHDYEEVDFNVVVFDNIDLVDQYYQALLTNDPPDIMIISAADAGAFSGIEGLETLNEPPYYDEVIFNQRPETVLNQYVNESGEMYGFPVHLFPYVTFYRHDILAEFGFPSDPEDLAEYMSGVDQYFDLISSLYDEGLYAFQSTQSMLEWGLNSSYPFDENHQYLYQEPPFSDLLETIIKIDEQEWDVFQSIWEDSGYGSLKENRLVMFQAPSYVANIIYNWFPEQGGNWRMTSLPLEMSGLDKGAGLIAMIPSQSQEKRIAWDLIQLIADNLYNIHVHPNSHPMFDQTNINQFYLSEFDKPSLGRPSMLDQTAKLLWDNSIYQINQGAKVDQIYFEQTHNQLLDQIRNNQRVLTDD